MLGCYVMGPFAMGPLVIGSYVGAPFNFITCKFNVLFIQHQCLNWFQIQEITTMERDLETGLKEGYRLT